ncbi:hypothetical protein CPter291_2419 [Collimonas pratensis]|uniref:Uncharacterized protein n=1 Tax=Collimonas pratensis TaxID=279113 RepID=A0ABM5Z6K7_9BURK|nr:hypothetical protein CPter291_2419 [Collimonas pratensis]
MSTHSSIKYIQGAVSPMIQIKGRADDYQLPQRANTMQCKIDAHSNL